MPGVDLVFGPMLVGVFFNCILYGILVMQTFIYFQTYKSDSHWIRNFIVYLFILETINTGCDIGTMYEPLIIQFGMPHAVEFFPYLLASSPIITVLISTPVQMFTAWRISVIAQGAKGWILGSIISFFALASFGGGLWTTYLVASFRFFARKPELNPAGITWFVSSAVADFLITISLIHSLSRRRSGHKTTDSSINRIIRLTIQTGAVTSLFAIADLASFSASPQTAISFIWDFSLSKLYTNALLSTLNARSGWGNLTGHNDNPDNVLFGRETLSSRGNVSLPHFHASGNPSIASNAYTTGNYELQSSRAKPERAVRINVTTRVEQDDPGSKKFDHAL